MYIIPKDSLSSLVLALAATVSQVGRDSFCVIGLLNRVLFEQPSKHHRTHAQDAQPRGSGSKTSNVPRSIRLWPKPGRVDRGRISDRIDQRNGDSSLSGRLGNDIGDPGLDEW